MTPDSIPIVLKAQDLEGYINTFGLYGQGYKLGSGLEKVIARLATGKSTAENDEILDEFSLYRDSDKIERLK